MTRIEQEQYKCKLANTNLTDGTDSFMLFWVREHIFKGLNRLISTIIICLICAICVQFFLDTDSPIQSHIINLFGIIWLL